MKMEGHNSANGAQGEALDGMKADPRFAPNTRSCKSQTGMAGRYKPLEGVHSGNAGGSPRTTIPLQVKEEPVENLVQHWEAQWQVYLRTVGSPHSELEVASLPEEPAPWDDTKAFLASFEQVAEACHWPRDEWVGRLLPALCGEAEQAYHGLEEVAQGDYRRVKAAILLGDAISREKKRQHFRHFCYKDAEGPRGAYSHLQELCSRWLKVERRSKEQILELLILEQFLTILPQEIQDWVRERGPETCAQAVALAEDFLLQQRAPEHQGEQVGVDEEETTCVWEADQDPCSAAQNVPPGTKQEDDAEGSLLAGPRRMAEHVGEPWGTPEYPEPVQSHGTLLWKAEEIVLPGREQDSASLRPGTPELQQGCSTEKGNDLIPCGRGYNASTETTAKAGADSAGDGWESENEGEQPGMSSEQGKREELEPNFWNQDSPEGQERNRTEERDRSIPSQGEDWPETQLKTHTEKRRNVCLGARWRSHPGEKPNKSSTFGKSFSRSRHLALHKRIRTEEKANSCIAGRQTFPQKSSLLQYQKSHTGESTNAGLTSPQRIQTSKVLYSCSDCSKCFCDQSSLVKHKRMHSGEKPHQCLECGKSFNQKAHLTVHQRIHTGERPYKCSDCSKSFSDLSGLIRHKRIHTKEEPYKCFKCGRTFRQSTHLTRHHRTHEGGEA